MSSKRYPKESKIEAVVISTKRHSVGEVARAGKIPVTPQVDQDNFNTAKLIAVSNTLPSVKVSTNASVAEFLESDSGY